MDDVDSAERDRRMQTGEEPDGYQPPTIRRLGTLAELTRGGALPIQDAQGGSGFS